MASILDLKKPPIQPRKPVEAKQPIPVLSTGEKPVVLIIMDGWGHNPDERQHDANAIALAETPNFDALCETYPTTYINTSSIACGLPAGQMGNSEVGHMTIGAGRVPLIPGLNTIGEAIENGTLYSNPELVKYVTALKASGGTCHLSGLLSDGGVHSHQDHLLALAKFMLQEGINVNIHAMTDGRDTGVKTALSCINRFENELKAFQENLVDSTAKAKIVTIGGRSYGMDRDNNWEDKIKPAYDAMTHAKGQRFTNPQEAIAASYNNRITDEFILPCVTDPEYQGMKDGDGFLFANFRADRAVQISTAMNKNFLSFDRGNTPALAAKLGMCMYGTEVEDMPPLFAPEPLVNTLGEVIATAGMTQSRIAETEKSAHVTFFMSGGRHELFDGETRETIPSPKVNTYAEKPEMSAEGVADAAIKAIESGQDVVIVNFANPDMVGHTGNLEATIKAVEEVDTQLKRIMDAVDAKGGKAIITADHGNAEQEKEVTKEGELTDTANTKHTTNLVPLIIAGRGMERFAFDPSVNRLNEGLLDNHTVASFDKALAETHEKALEEGKDADKAVEKLKKSLMAPSLANIAPLILDLLGLEKPLEMSHNSLANCLRPKQLEMSASRAI